MSWPDETDETVKDLVYVPLQYEVTFNGKTLSSETVTNEEGSFICIPDFNLMFETGKMERVMRSHQCTIARLIVLR